MRRGAKPAKAKGEDKAPAAGKSPKDQGSRIRDLEKRLAEARQREADALKRESEALERQTATAEVLRIISGAPTDLQPVFDAILDSVMRLFRPWSANVCQFDGELVHLAATRGGPSEAGRSIRDRFPSRPTAGLTLGRCILDRAVIEIHDVETDAGLVAATREMARARGWRSALAVPMLRDGEPVGAIMVTRIESGRFESGSVELLQTFADQAVIAIENVRLFHETKEALERQTAASEILRVISSSPTDTQPVFDTIAASAARQCAARDAQVLRVDGDVLRLVSAYGSPSMPPVRTISRGHAVGRAVIDRQTIHVRDMAQAIAEFPETSAPQHGVESVLAVPLLREDVAVGVIRISRTQRQPFTEQQIALLKTFADQAVIAIENVRLFTELQEKNKALTQAHAQVTEALEQQTATADILRVISGSPTDLQPVFDSMLQSAVRLLGGFGGAILLYDGSALHLGAVTGGQPQSGAEDWFRSIFPLQLDPDTPIGTAILERRMIQLPDTEESVSQTTREVARGFQFRALITVPMLREGSAIGTISITRAAPGEFSERQIEVLQTFADQAVIAIENVRLFKELEASNREIADTSRQLEAASQHKSEFLANMSHELRTPLNAIIGFSEVLSERMFGELNEKQEEYLKDIYASGTHLLSLINDILDLSKIEAGRMEMELTDFRLPQAIENALILVRERAGRAGVALNHSVDERLGEIRGDERKVKQVLLNLLSNALKFTPEGGRVDVRVAMVDDMAEISVTDTGVGIAPEDQEAVFEEFRQVGTADKKAEGTGLGLALCRKFVELHGGKIWVKSQIGVGSTFAFTIPVHRVE